MFQVGNKKKMAALSEILEPRFVERFLIEENNSYEDKRVQFAKCEEILQSAPNQEANVSVRQYARSCRAKCYFRGRAIAHFLLITISFLFNFTISLFTFLVNVFLVDLKLHVISILFTTVDYTVYLMYCPTSGAKCKRLNILSMNGSILGGPRI